MEYSISPQAEADLEEIGDYIAQDNPRRADTFTEEIRERFRAIARAPLAYAARPEIQPGIRSCAHRQYVIFFYVTDTSVEIARVLHGARNIARLFQP